MPKQSKLQRNAEQQERQRKLREGAKKARRPSRDDIARMLLWQMIIGLRRRTGGRRVLDRFRDEIVDCLEGQGFSVRESEEVFEDLVRKYADGMFPFRPKRHLKTEPSFPPS